MVNVNETPLTLRQLLIISC